MSDKRAIIDIGSNTVRLVIYNGPPRAPVVLHNEKVTPKLGKDVSKTGTLSDKAMAMAMAGLSRYVTILDLKGVKNVETVATAAVRDAPNGGAFLAEVEKLGLRPRLLSGDEEARTSAMGVIAAFPGSKGLVGDLGGGSLELVAFDGETCEAGISLPFGTLRLPDLRRGGPARFASRLRSGLEQAGWSKGSGLPFFIVGGSWRALALHAMQDTGWPLDDPHDFELSPDDALRICEPLSRGKIEPTDPRISSARLATLPDAAALLGALVSEIGPSRIVFSSWGLREGLLYRQLDAVTRARDPMIEGVEAFVRDAGVSLSTARRMAAWIAPALAEADAHDASLRLAATMLALASMRSEPNVRAEQAISWALRKRWIGLDARGRAMMAMTVFANTGNTEVPPALAELASKQDFTRAAAWGLALRVCRKLTGCADTALERTGLSREGDVLALQLDEPMRPLFNSSVAKNLRVLADWLGCDWSADATERPLAASAS